MNDLISRQAAIAEFSCCKLTPDGGIDANYAIDFLEQMPSAQPDADMIHLQKEQAYMQGWEDAKASTEPKTGGEIGRREHDDIVVEGINIYCPNCGYKTTIIGTVNKPNKEKRNERLNQTERCDRRNSEERCNRRNGQGVFGERSG